MKSQICITVWTDLVRGRGLAVDVDANTIFFHVHNLADGMNMADIRGGNVLCITSYPGTDRSGKDVSIVDYVQWSTREEAIEMEGPLRDALEINRIETAKRRAAVLQETR